MRTVYAVWVEEDGRFGFSTKDNGGVEITAEQHQDLIDGESSGKRITRAKNGFPVLGEPLPLSGEQLVVRERQWRDAEIESIKWLRERHRDEVDSQRATTLSVEQSGELLDYMQQLRDWPAASDFPSSVRRPVKPEWIAEQYV